MWNGAQTLMAGSVPDLDCLIQGRGEKGEGGDGGGDGGDLFLVT